MVMAMGQTLSFLLLKRRKTCRAVAARVKGGGGSLGMCVQYRRGEEGGERIRRFLHFRCCRIVFFLFCLWLGTSRHIGMVSCAPIPDPPSRPPSLPPDHQGRCHQYLWSTGPRPPARHRHLRCKQPSLALPSLPPPLVSLPPSLPTHSFTYPSLPPSLPPSRPTRTVTM